MTDPNNNITKIKEDDIPSFKQAKNKAQQLETDSYHKPSNSRCGCNKTTGNGAYRDVMAQMDSITVFFYHQSPVVVAHEDGTIRLDSCGYRTRTTKQRINNHMPKGYSLRQRQGDWIVDTPRGEKQFEDGMHITAKERAVMQL